MSARYVQPGEQSARMYLLPERPDILQRKHLRRHRLWLRRRPSPRYLWRLRWQRLLLLPTWSSGRSSKLPHPLSGGSSRDSPKLRSFPVTAAADQAAMGVARFCRLAVFALSCLVILPCPATASTKIQMLPPIGCPTDGVTAGVITWDGVHTVQCDQVLTNALQVLKTCTPGQMLTVTATGFSCFSPSSPSSCPASQPADACGNCGGDGSECGGGWVCPQNEGEGSTYGSCIPIPTICGNLITDMVACPVCNNAGTNVEGNGPYSCSSQ
jgi:hypothetical protein